MKPVWLISFIALFIVGCGDGGNGGSVPPPAAHTITVTPAASSLKRGDSMQLGATLRDVGGNILQAGRSPGPATPSTR
jgi:hypothetical protein